MVEARSDLHKTEAAHAASKAELEARVSNALSKSTADEAKSRVLRERIASVKQELALLRETAAETQVHEAATQDGAEFQDMPIELQTAFSELQEEKEVLEQRVAKVLVRAQCKHGFPFLNTAGPFCFIVMSRCGRLLLV